MFLPFNSDLKLTEQTFNAEKYTSINSLTQARLTEPDLFNSAITYAYGSDSTWGRTNFPLLFYTQGMGRKRGIKSVDTQYIAYMYGKPKKTSRIFREVSQGSEVGKGGVRFKLVFEDRWFQKGQVLQYGGASNFQVRIQTDLTPYPGGGFQCDCMILTGSSTVSVPAGALKKNALWAGGPVKVSLQKSKGTEQRSQTPFKMTNQLSMLRSSFNYAGNIANKTINMTMNIDGKPFTLWVEWEKYYNELLFQEQKEHDLIFSPYNRTADGKIINVDDDSEEAVPSGMGIWDQITQTLEYGMLTESKLDSFLQDIAYNNGTSNASGERVIMAGTGMLMEIDRALKNASNGLQMIQSADNYVRKDDKGLQYGGYFTSYLHRSGVTLRFVKHPLFDDGPAAAAAPRHPKYPNMSIMSFSGMALDFSFVDVDKRVSGGKSTESNIVYLYEEGREYREWIVPGGAPLPGQEMPKYGATDVDASASHMYVTQGAHLNRPSMCAKFICTLS